MKIKWHPRANNFWLARLEEPAKVLLKSFDGSYHDSNIGDLAYVYRNKQQFAIRFYGSLYSGTHPVERMEFATKEKAMLIAEEYATAILAAKILSR
jgi:hypothetical protein